MGAEVTCLVNTKVFYGHPNFVFSKHPVLQPQNYPEMWLE